MMLLRRLLPLALPLVLGVTALGCSAEAELTDEPGESEDNLVATFDKKGAIDLTKPSRILLVGDSDKLGNLPLFAATGKARRYAQLYPNDQIVLFITQDAKADDVAKAVEAAGLGRIDKRKVELPAHIKSVGSYQANVRLHEDVAAVIDLDVVAI